MNALITRTGATDSIRFEGIDIGRVKPIFDRCFAYKMKGAEYSEKYRNGWWDGKIRLCRSKGDAIHAPSGLFPEIVEVLERKGFTVVVEADHRPPDYCLDMLRDWRGWPLRDYQRQAVQAALQAEVGILRLPTRSGKTTIAARIIYELDVRTLFLVTSSALMYQAAKEIQRSLPDVSVGCFGDDVDERDADVVVATIQTLTTRGAQAITARSEPRWRVLWPHGGQGSSKDKTRVTHSLMAPDAGPGPFHFSCVILDELHHMSSQGKAWREMASQIPARYRFGLSATIDVSRKAGMETSAIWLRGLCGRICYSLEPHDLMERGFLVAPTIRFVEHGAPHHKARSWSPAVYKEAVVQCSERNAKIVEIALDEVAQGRSVLVDVYRRPHGRQLFQALREHLRSDEVVLLMGGDGSKVQQAAESMAQKRLKVIVGNILGEGVDIPSLEVVINAEGGRGDSPAIQQRMRNLTMAFGKQHAIVYEMVDDHQKHLCDHTLSRLAFYEGMKGCTIEVPS